MKKPRPLSKEEFIKHEAARCGVSVAYLKRIVNFLKCDCGHWVCRGWVTEPKRGLETSQTRLVKARSRS